MPKHRPRSYSSSHVVAHLAIAASISVACHSTDPSSPTDVAGRLKAATGVEWIIDEDPTLHNVWFAMPRDAGAMLPEGGSLDASFLSFLAANASIFGMTDPQRELQLESTTRDERGLVHLRFHQVIGGVPVEGAAWIARIEATKRLRSMSGRYVPELGKLDLSPRVSKSAAIAAARADVSTRRPELRDASQVASAAKLEVHVREDGTPVLAYRVEVDVDPLGQLPLERAVYQVDAATARILSVQSRLRRATASGYGSGHYDPFNRPEGMKTFPVSDAPPPTLEGTTEGVVVRTVVKGSKAPIAATSTSPWVDATEPPGMSVDLQAHTAQIVSFFAALRHDGQPWRSYDGRGSPIVAVLDPAEQGAYWEPKDNEMHIGPGFPSIGSLPSHIDNVAHEFAHGVTQYTSKLPFDHGEASAINESMSDVFTAFVGHHVGQSDEDAFKMWEGFWMDGRPLRSFAHPSSSDAAVEQGFDHVTTAKATDHHRGGGIPNNAFFLLTHGGTNDTSRRTVPCGIGWESALKLYWALQTSYVLPGETFRKLALHSLEAAKNLGIQLEPVGCAWAAVGVLEDADLAREWSVECRGVGPDSRGASGQVASRSTLVSPVGPLLVCDSAPLLK